MYKCFSVVGLIGRFLTGSCLFFFQDLPTFFSITLSTRDYDDANPKVNGLVVVVAVYYSTSFFARKYYIVY
jgi:hypothetical protein